MARCVNDFYETHPVVNNKLLSIRVFYRRIICLNEKNNENDATGSISTRIPNQNNIPLRSGGAARSVSAHVGKRVSGRWDSPTKQLRVNWKTHTSGRAMGGDGTGDAYLDGQGSLSDASITQHCNSPTVHIWKGSRGSGGC